MKKIKTFITTTILLHIPPSVFAGENGGAVERTVNISRLRGFSRWLGVLYNDHRVIYAFISLGIMIAMGLVIGLTVESILTKLGYQTGKTDHTE